MHHWMVMHDLFWWMRWSQHRLRIVLLGQISVKSKIKRKQKTETRTFVDIKTVAHDNLLFVCLFVWFCSTDIKISFTFLIVSHSTGETQKKSLFLKFLWKLGKEILRSSDPKVVFGFFFFLTEISPIVSVIPAAFAVWCVVCLWLYF